MPLPPRHGLYDPQSEHDSCGVGFVAHIRGVKSHGIVQDALTVLQRMAHRGATGSDPHTGDGAGLLVQIPNRFFQLRLREQAGWDLPGKRRYAVGQVFLPVDPDQRRACQDILDQEIEADGHRIVGWRDVPVDPSVIGDVARAGMPVVRQVFVARRRCVPTAFNRRLYVIRKLAEKRIREEGVDPTGAFHVCSFSGDTIVYKGQLTPAQLPAFYADLREPDFVASIALVHSRFSTNTTPTWDRAQPCRYLCHNGEINTLRGNRNWMRARGAQLASAKFPGGLSRLEPIIVPEGSDSFQFDNMLELLHLGGRSLPHAMMSMIPEAWQRNPSFDPARRAFYDYSSAIMEPWDGPAAICFTDGSLIGATLDRNGLRPARYTVTEDDRVILGSETGVLDLPADQVRARGSLAPGRMLIVDTVEKRILDDAAVKTDIISRFPYRHWLLRNEVRLSAIAPSPAPPRLDGDGLRRCQQALGWSSEDVDVVLAPMAETGAEPTGSMGNDTPLAMLSDAAPSLFRYVKQLFAQVTNPPIDPIREREVMSLRTSIGGGGNPFDETPEQCHRVVLDRPILTNTELHTLLEVREGIFEPVRLSTLYSIDQGPDALARAVDALCRQAREAVDEGNNVLVLSDRGMDATRAPIPALLAVSAVHQHLVREGTRLLTGLVVETAEALEVHHIACLRGFGAGAVNPWLAFDTVEELASTGVIPVSPQKARDNYIAAVGKGLLKIMSKMGISTMASYTGAQLFELVGLDQDLVDRHFTGTPSRIRGIGMRELHQEVLVRHARSYDAASGGRALDDGLLPTGGIYAWRRRGERHQWNPATLASLQHAVRHDDERAWRRYNRLLDDAPGGPTAPRDLLELVDADQPVPLDQVESVESIITRFATGAMSFGSLSAEAHETLAIAMNRMGGKSNSGEGGEELRRSVPDDNGDSRRSAIKQVASGRFGVHAAYLRSADELQIKMAQGAKPGEGGQLPGHKVSERIATVRCSTPGVTLISPPPHHDIYSIEDLAQLIYDLGAVNPDARISVKLVSEYGVGTIAAGVAKARADMIVIAGASGGTGASPLSSVQHAGLPWELGLAEAQQVLVQTGLRGRVRLQVDGGLRTARDVAIGALLGAEEFGFATAALVTMGCVMLRKCHLNTCSVGIATQDPALTARFAGDPQHVTRFFRMIAQDLRVIMARLGFRSLDEMVGRVDRLRQRRDLDHWKLQRVDLGELLVAPRASADSPRRHATGQRHDLDDHLDHRILAHLPADLAATSPTRLSLPITNRDRAVGALLSGQVAAACGPDGLPEDTVTVTFQGTAGQSFGAFLAAGLSFRVHGDANDYVGKGLSGGHIVIRPPADVRYRPQDNIIIGNVALYGATGGSLFLHGRAGERFAVRNSGATAVVEGVGDHCCEYMTGGTVVVLGPTGRNFAAGMSGGVAYVLDPDGSFADRVNPGLVELEPVDAAEDVDLLQGLLRAHLQHTDSEVARTLLDRWSVPPPFVKVMPTDYRRALQARRRADAQGAILPEVLRGSA